MNAVNNEALLRDPYVAAFPENVPFWDAAARGTLVLPRCTACGETHWHPRAFCPSCRSLDLHWDPASGCGTLHTWTVVRRPQGDTLLAYVQLEEGPLMLTNIVDAEPDALHIGMALQVAFRAAPEGRMAPVFRPA